jgi:hypothetical protein
MRRVVTGPSSDGKSVFVSDSEVSKAGDCVVRNGTRHAWHNRTSQPCTLMSVLVGARRSKV